MFNRITGNETLKEIIVILGDGNPGAIKVLAEYIKRHPEACVLGILTLDHKEIYGPRIWMLWKDVCKEDSDVFDSCLNDVHNKLQERIDKKIKDSPMFGKEWEYYGDRQRNS
jgi:hypothetical protein